MKLLFIPFGVTSGFVSGFIAKRLFRLTWGLIDDKEPPEPKHRDVSTGKVVLAAALEGAIFRGTRVAVDHKAREAFFNLTGVWPGEEKPETE
jgi:hypothetical protein